MKMKLLCSTGEEFAGRAIRHEKEIDLSKVELWELISIWCRIPASKIYKSTFAETKNMDENMKMISSFFFYTKDRLLHENDDDLVWALKSNRTYGSHTDLYPFYNLITAEYARRMITFE